MVRFNCKSPFIKSLLLLIFSAHSIYADAKVNSFQQEKLDSIQLRQLLNEAWALTDSAEYESALELYDKLVRSSYEDQRWEEYVEAMRGLGLNYTRLGKEKESLKIRKQLVVDSYKYLSKDNSNIGISEKELSLSYQRMGMYDSSIHHIQKALSHNLQYLGEYNSTTSRTINTIGFLHSKLEALDSALKYYSWSHEILQGLENMDYYLLGIVQNNLGATYRKLGNYDLQADYLKKALVSFERSRGPNHPVLATIYNNLANAYKQSGDFDNQLQFINEALKIRKKNFEEKHPYIAESYTSLAEFHILHSKDLTAFFRYANLALKINKAVYPDIHEKIASGLHLLGKGYQQEGRFSLAFSKYQESLEMYQKIWGNRHGSITIELVAMADCIKEEGNSAKAIDLLNSALEIRLDIYGKKHPLVASIYKKLAQIEISEERDLDGLNLIQLAIASLSSDFDDKDPLKNPGLDEISSQLDLLELLKMKGKVALELFHTDKDPDVLLIATKAYQLAIDLADEIRFKILSGTSQDQLTELAYPAYQGGVASAWELFLSTEDEAILEGIWSMVERSRSFRLRLAQQKENIEKYGGVPDSLVRREKTLIAQITTLKETASRTKDSLKVKRLNDLIFSKELQLKKLTEVLREEYEQYYHLMYSLDIVTIEETQENLKHSDAIVSFFSSDDQLFSIVVTKADFFVLEAPKPEDYQLLIASFRKASTDFQMLLTDPKKARELYVESSSQLFDILFKDLLKKLPSISNIIIAPDMQLSTINFEGLLAGPVSSNDSYVDFPYLIKSHNLTYAHSLTHMFRSKDRIVSNEVLFGGFAPSYSSDRFQEDLGTNQMFDQLVRSGEWDLPGAREEVVAINQLLEGKVWVGDEATERDL